MNGRVRHRVFGVLAIVFAIATPSAAQTAEEQWYVLELGGQHCGWASEGSIDDGVHVRTISEQHLRYRRGENDVVDVSVRVEWTESQAGSPIEITTRWDLDGSVTVRRWRFDGSMVHEEVSTGIADQRTSSRSFPEPADEWLMPHAADEFVRRRRETDTSTITYRAADVSSGFKVVDMRLTHMGDGRFDLAGRMIPVSTWRLEQLDGDGRAGPTSSILTFAEDGVIVHAEERLGAMVLTQRLTSENVARRPVGDPPELLVQTFVRPNRPIDRAQRIRNAKYIVRPRGSDSIDLPSAGAQRTERLPDGTVRIAVNIDDPIAAEEGMNEAEYLSTSALVDTTDPEIIAMRDRSLARMPADAARRAERLRVAVNRHISDKGLAAAFASASETVRSRTGDCSEHALLLCALLRADGIPARVATGLIYAREFAGERDIFAWHMWTQALINGAWVDLDATMGTPFSAAHILTSTSSLDDGAMSDEFLRAAKLIGTIEIDVVEYAHRRK